MLVSGEREIINSTDVSPIPVGRKIGSLDIFVRKRTSNKLGGILVRFTSTFSVSEIVGLIVGNRNLSGVSNIISPGIQGDSPVTAVTFNIEHVNTSQLSEETLFTPIRSPRISDDPVLFIVFFTPTNNFDDMVGSRVLSGVIVDTTSVIVSQKFGSINVTSNRTSVEDFLHHLAFTLNITIFSNGVDLGVLLGPATLTRHAVLTHNLSRATKTIIVTIGLIRRTGFISDIVFFNPLESSTRVTTMTSSGVLIARD